MDKVWYMLNGTYFVNKVVFKSKYGNYRTFRIIVYVDGKYCGRLDIRRDVTPLQGSKDYTIECQNKK